MSRFGALSAILVLILSACATPSPERPGRERPSPPAGNAASGDADQLAAAALKARAAGRNVEQALALTERASELAPERADLVWLHSRMCMEARGCEPEPIEARLRKLDPRNGVVWLGVLARAQARRDGRAEEQILQAMSRAERFDLHWTTMIWRLTRARSPGPARSAHPLTTALDETTEWLSAIAAPAFRPVSVACTQERMRNAAIATHCRNIAEAMRRSDTTLVEGMGLGIAQRLAEPHSSAAALIAERIAILSYQSQTAGAVIRSQLEREKFSAEILELMKQLRREQDVSTAIVRWAGEPLTPPAR